VHGLTSRSVPSPLAFAAHAGLLELAGTVASVAVGAATLVAAGSLLLRFRRARGVERQQLRCSSPCCWDSATPASCS
jgi:hypothetical protein